MVYLIFVSSGYSVAEGAKHCVVCVMRTSKHIARTRHCRSEHGFPSNVCRLSSFIEAAFGNTGYKITS